MAHTYFVMREPGKEVQALVWDTRTLSIGRSPENDLTLEDEAISRKHALFKNENGVMEVGDYNTGNGTYVNGERVQSTRKIEDGDVITLGELQLELHQGETHPAKSGHKLTYASHLKTVGSIPQMGDGNATMLGMMDTLPPDEPFVIEPQRSSGSQAFIAGSDSADSFQVRPLVDDGGDELSIELDENFRGSVIDLDAELGAELDLLDSVDEKPPPPRREAPRTTANRTPAPQRPAPAGPNSNAQSGDDLVARMQKLSALHDAGMITDPEFERKRAEILGEI